MIDLSKLLKTARIFQPIKRILIFTRGGTLRPFPYSIEHTYAKPMIARDKNVEVIKICHKVVK